MARLTPKHALTLLSALVASAALSACGSQEVELDAGANARVKQGAQIFDAKCAGCHTLESAGAQGSAVKIGDRERVDGPNFNTRAEQKEAVLYAIRNGGFSGAIMPENIIVGDEAEKVAEYLAEYSGKDAVKPVTPNAGTPGTGDQSP